MIDQLLGRASLKTRIDELEDENERLRRRYEAESDRRAAAATAKQDAEAQQNRLEDRIAQLEGELERVDDDGATGPTVRRRERVRGSRLEEVLDRLESLRTGPEGALTASITDERNVPDAVENALGERAALASDAAPCLLCVDDASLVSVGLKSSLVSVREPNWSDRFDLEREWFLPTGRFALVLVRADLFALGVYEGDERQSYRGFESDVKGNHSKGGFSQARFERIRDDQIDDHLERCRDAIAEYDGERLYLVGQRGVVDTLAAEAAVDPDAMAAVDATGNPKSALEDAFRSFWTTEIVVF